MPHWLCAHHRAALAGSVSELRAAYMTRQQLRADGLKKPLAEGCTQGRRVGTSSCTQGTAKLSIIAHVARDATWTCLFFSSHFQLQAGSNALKGLQCTTIHPQ